MKEGTAAFTSDAIGACEHSFDANIPSGVPHRPMKVTQQFGVGILTKQG